MQRLSVIVLAAGINIRQKMLLNVNGNALIKLQVEIIKRAFPRSEIIYVLGHEHEKIISSLPSDVRVILNEKYNTTNTTHSLGLALRAIVNSQALVIYGDTLFDEEVLQTCIQSKSTIHVSEDGNKDRVGISTWKRRTICLNYGLQKRWSQLVYLRNNEFAIAKELCLDSDCRTLSVFEILNMVIQKGGSLIPVESKYGKTINVKSSNDIAKFIRVV